MSEEEKKAVEGLKDYVARIKKFHFEQTQGFKWLDTILNLIEKQQNEIKNLKENYIYYLEEKLMYSLGPKNKEFADDTQQEFRKILEKSFKENADTYTIHEKFLNYYKGVVKDHAK